MKIEDARIGMEVKFSHPSCTYFIENIYSDKKTVFLSLVSSPKPKETLEQRILADIETILSKGTRIKSFEYNGTTRNVLIGSKDADNYVSWGKRLNRAVIYHEVKDKHYLVAVDNNDYRTIKNFDISKIRGW